jgi:hypothetical protein
LHIHRNQQGFATHIGGSSSGFATCVTSTYNYNIVFLKHSKNVPRGTSNFLGGKGNGLVATMD